MRSFVQSANFPLSCSGLIYGAKYEGILKSPLDSLHISSLLLPDNPDIDRRLSGHADLSLLHAGGNRLIAAPYLKGSAFSHALESDGAELFFPSFVQKPRYPFDAQLNLCLLGSKSICSPETVPPEVVDFLTNNASRQMIRCRQGYARCVSCLPDEGSIITADRGVAKAAERAGMAVLLITEGGILLDGYACGFLGGASFKISADKMAFTGRLDGHPDHGRILDFLSARSIEAIFLTEDPVFDIGTAIPLYEK